MRAGHEAPTDQVQGVSNGGRTLGTLSAAAGELAYVLNGAAWGVDTGRDDMEGEKVQRQALSDCCQHQV